MIMNKLSLILLLTLLLQARNPVLAETSEPSSDNLKPFGQQGARLPVDQVDGFLPPKEFIDNYVLKNKPVVFKGAAKKSPAFVKWTDEYLGAVAPPRPAGDVFIEHSKKENRSQAYNFVHLKKFLEIYNTSNIYMVSDVPDYLLQDLVLPYPLQCKFFLQGGLDTHVVWFSSGGTSSVIHHDAYENINCLYRGRKSLVFLNTTKYNDKVEKIIDKEDGSFSSADVDKIDTVNRPEFRDLEFHIADMDTGDCLYIPLFWVHQVRSFENNLAVNIWWNPRNSYPLDICSPAYNTKLKFDRVYFKSIETNIKKDVDNIRQLFQAILKEKTEAGLLAALSAANSEVAAGPEFSAVVSALFKSMDFDMDGALSDEELNRKLKRKEYRPIYKAIEHYNVLVYRMHELAGNGPAADALPKLLQTSNSDDGMFAPHRTWQPAQPPAPVDEDEMAGEGGADDWQPKEGSGEANEGQQQAESEKKKEEL